MYDSIPWFVAVPLALILWLTLWWKVSLKAKVADFFAHRRHVRRMKKYLRADLKATAALYKTPATDNLRRMVVTHDTRVRN